MSIIIKGMDMPKPDTFNNIIIHSNGQVAMPFWGKGMQAVEGIEAQQLPPHGRLIDADELIEQVNQSIAEQEKVFDSIKEDPIGKQSVWVDIMHDERIVRILRDAPTIIEAEEEEQ